MEVVKQQKALNKVMSALLAGKIVICPTDTVYGFLADATNKKAVEKIYKIKKRARSKPLPVFVRDIKMARELANISTSQEKVLKKYWPGKYTFILKIKKKTNRINIGSLSGLVIGKDGTIALRIPKYKFLNNLLKKINKPLAQTSANISGEPELKKIKEIIAKFENNKNKPDLIIDGGDLLRSKSSKVIDLTGGGKKVLRY